MQTPAINQKVSTILCGLILLAGRTSAAGVAAIRAEAIVMRLSFDKAGRFSLKPHHMRADGLPTHISRQSKTKVESAEDIILFAQQT